MIRAFNRILCASLLCVSFTAALASAAMDEAQALINNGNYVEALNRLDAHLKQVPQDAEARFARGLVLVKLNRTEQAIASFAELTRDYPQLPEPYNNLAVLYAQQGDYEKARDALEAALATHPSYATAHENLGDIYAALASAAYNRALMLDQGNATVRNKLRLMEQMDTLPESVASLPPPTRSESPPPAVTRAAQPAPASSRTADDSAERIIKSVNRWADAWSAQDVNGYLAAYAADFEPGGGMSRSAWQNLRRQRVSAPSQIRVSVRDPEIVRLSDGAARVSFLQIYESDTYADRTNKVLELRRDGGQWLITREYSR